MASQPGNNNNPAGRPKGVPNRTTQIVKELFAQILEGEQEHFVEALETLRLTNPKEYVSVMVKLSQRFLPEMSATAFMNMDGTNLEPIQVIIPSGPKKEEE
jgi:hypothetical protein